MPDTMGGKEQRRSAIKHKDITGDNKLRGDAIVIEPIANRFLFEHLPTPRNIPDRVRASELALLNRSHRLRVVTEGSEISEKRRERRLHLPAANGPRQQPVQEHERIRARLLPQLNLSRPQRQPHRTSPRTRSRQNRRNQIRQQLYPQHHCLCPTRK